MNKKLIAASFGAIGLTLMTVAPALAEEGRDRGPRMAQTPMGQDERMRDMDSTLGTVSAVSGSTITVAKKDGESVSIDASSATIVRVPNTSIQIADIKVGDTVLVRGDESDDVVTAVHISVGVPAAPQAMMRGADDQDDSGDDDRGPRDERGEMMATSAPQRLAGEREGWITGIGHALTNFFQKNKGDEDRGPRKFELGGAVTTIGANSFSVQTRASEDRATTTITITTDASTTYKKAGGTAATFADIASGSFVKVKGTLTSTTTMEIAALRVDIASSTPSERGQASVDMQGLRELRQEALEQAEQATSTQQLRTVITNFFQKLGGFFRF